MARATFRVWGTDSFFRHSAGGQCRAIVAATSKKAGAEALGRTLYAFNQSASETGNDEEVALALAQPGAVFFRALDARPPYQWGMNQ